MRVISLFDGISCGQVALERAGIRPSLYFAAEIDKHAVKITQRNFPNTVQMGDVRDVAKMAEAGLFGKGGLLIGGSPCQGFSSAGKGLGFTDPRSQLFFDYVRVLGAVQPDYFLLENVRMKQKDQDVISALLGVQPIMINSADFSAQNRVRLYWTNIPVAPWVDRGILLRDVLDGADSERGKSYCIDANYHKGTSVEQYFAKSRRQLVFNEPTLREKSCTVRTVTATGPHGAKQNWDHISNNPNLTWRRLSVAECERLQTLPDGYTEGVSNTQRYKAIGNGWTVDVIAHIFKGIPQPCSI